MTKGQSLFNTLLGFLCGSVVKTPCFHCRRHRFDSWSGNKDPACHTEQPKNRKKEKKILLRNRGASQVTLVVNMPAHAGDAGLIPGSGRSPGGRQGKPLQYSYMENPMDRGAWWATVHRVTKSRT